MKCQHAPCIWEATIRCPDGLFVCEDHVPEQYRRAVLRTKVAGIEELDLHVRPVPVSLGGGFEAIGMGGQYKGANCDEALGYAIKEAWLDGRLDNPIKINLSFDLKKT